MDYIKKYTQKTDDKTIKERLINSLNNNTKVMNYNVLTDVISYKHKDTCLTIAVEELSELQKEVCKLHRGKLRRDKLIEEIADVQIVIEWLKSIVNIRDEEIKAIKQQKIDRIINRYENDEFK